MRMDAMVDAPAGAPPACATAGAQRLPLLPLPQGGTLRIDKFGAAAECRFLLLAPASDGSAAIEFDGIRQLTACSAGGWTLAAGDGVTYWMPVPPLACRFDDAGRLQHDATSPPLLGFGLSAAGGRASWACGEGRLLHVMLWRFTDAGQASGLDSLNAIERQPLFMLGTHDTCRRPADMALHLIDGRVYECRKAWPHDYRVCSENDAHALHLASTALAACTGKPLHAWLRDQVLLSVLARQSPDGGYRHGEWTQGNESHYRLHCSAMHLMMDALAARPDPAVAEALGRAAAFIARQTAELSFGTWVLHDELEHSPQAFAQGPFRWVRSRAFGKAESNMLVLNSHLDATIALDRYAEISGDTRYAALVDSARRATAALLSLRSAEPLYRLLFALIGLTFLPTERAAALPWWQRALKRLAWQHLIPRLPDIKARFPRLVMPGGYIDRELTLRTFAHDYHAVNLMDLARHLRRFPDELPVRRALLEGLAFVRDSGLAQRWREMPYQRYALGFWAEALYHVCTLFTDAKYRAWLADVMQVLDDLQMGQPPSLLGANAEAVPPAQQLPCPSPTDGRLRVANLGRRGAPELLIVNPGTCALPLTWESPPTEAVRLHCADSRVVEAAAPVVPARSWLWARAADS